MVQNETVKFGEPLRDTRGALNLNEGVLRPTTESTTGHRNERQQNIFRLHRG